MSEYTKNPIFKQFVHLCSQHDPNSLEQINQLLPQVLEMVDPDQTIKLLVVYDQSLLHFLTAIKDVEYELLFKRVEKKINCDILDIYGRTPLYLACINCNNKAARVLLNHGANVNSIKQLTYFKRSSTPLRVLTRNCGYHDNPEFFQLLIDYGASINYKDELDENALHSVCHRNDLPIIKFLIENGGDSKAKNSNGETPIDKITDPMVKNDVVSFIEKLNLR